MNGAPNMVDLLGAFGRRPNVPPNWDQIRNGIFAGESGGDYNALYGYQNRPGGQFENVRLTDMTVNQALDFANPSGPYGQSVKAQIGRVATPMGAYQVVGTTLREAVKGLGLTGNEKMTPEIQDLIGQWIYAKQGTGAWEGYRGPRQDMPNGGGVMAAAIPGQTVTSAMNMPQEQKRPSIWDRIGGALADPDTRARLQIALEGMTLNPNQGVVQAAQAGIDSRTEEKRINRTAEWLKSQGRDDLAAAVLAGSLSGSDAAQIALTPAQSSVDGVVVGGKIIDRNTGQVIYADATEANGFRKATPEEAAAYGATGGQFGPDGRFYPINPPSGMSLTTNPDGSTTLVQGPGAGAVKPFTEAQSKDVVYATRAKGALDTFEPVADSLTSLPQRAAGLDPTGLIRGRVQTGDFQVAQQAGDEFLQAILRKDTGAAITSQEQALYGTTFLPQPGDGPEVLAAKKASRQRAVAAIEAGMSPSQILAQENALRGQGAAVQGAPDDLTPEERQYLGMP